MSTTSVSAIADSIYSLLVRGMSTKQVGMNVAAYLVAERRTRDLDAIMREVERLRASRDGITEVSITSTYPLSEDIKQAASRLLGAKKAIFSQKLDGAMVSGARFETLEKQLDLTAKRKLDYLRGYKE